jgi:hypothetical protein
VAALLALAACGSFEDPSIVLDLRILAMVAEPPEQVVVFDPQNPLATELDYVLVTALVADPAAQRGLTWSMTLCPPQSGRRCYDDRPSLFLGEGRLDDPERSAAEQVAFVFVPPGPELLAILQDTIEHDSVSGFGGIDLTVSLRVVPEGGGEDEAVYGFKSVRYSPLLPAERVANTNPFLDHFAIAEGVIEVDALRRGRCVDQGAPWGVMAGGTVTIVPIEPEGVREDYVLPTFEGGSRMFTEYLSYQWLATGGDWTRGNSGGPRDGAGNEPSLGSTWKAPEAEDLDGPTDFGLWIMYRDERGGGAWFESCVRVFP